MSEPSYRKRKARARHARKKKSGRYKPPSFDVSPQWIIVVLLACILIGGGYAWYQYQQAEEEPDEVIIRFD